MKKVILMFVAFLLVFSSVALGEVGKRKIETIELSSCFIFPESIENDFIDHSFSVDEGRCYNHMNSVLKVMSYLNLNYIKRINNLVIIFNDYGGVAEKLNVVKEENLTELITQVNFISIPNCPNTRTMNEIIDKNLGGFADILPSVESRVIKSANSFIKKQQNLACR